MPAQAGILPLARGWIPAFAGTTTHEATLSAPHSSVHPRPFGNLVDDLLVFAQSEANDIHGVGRVLPDGGAIGRVVTGREHVLDIEREAHFPLHRAAIDRLQRLPIRAENNRRLD